MEIEKHLQYMLTYEYQKDKITDVWDFSYINVDKIKCLNEHGTKPLQIQKRVCFSCSH